MSRQIAKPQSRDHVRLNVTKPGDPADHTLRQSVDITRVRLPMTLAELSPAVATASILVDTMLHHATEDAAPQKAREATAAFLAPLRFQGVELAGNTAQLRDGRTYTVPVMLFNLDSTIEVGYFDARTGARRVASFAYHTERLATLPPPPPPPTRRLPPLTASSLSSSSSSGVDESCSTSDQTTPILVAPPPPPPATVHRIDSGAAADGTPSAIDTKEVATPVIASSSSSSSSSVLRLTAADRRRPLNSMWRVDPSGPTRYSGTPYTYLWLRRSALDALVAADRTRNTSLRDDLASSSSSLPTMPSDHTVAAVAADCRRSSEPVLVRAVSDDAQRVADERWEWYGDFVLQTAICAVTKTLLHMVIQRVRAINTHEPMAQFGDRVFGLRFVVLGLPPTP